MEGGMKLIDFRNATKDFDDDTEIIINGADDYYIKYVDLIYDKVPDGTPMMVTNKNFYKKRIEIELYK
jgi:hypothetical protein